MTIETIMPFTVPGLEGFAKLLAILVALYFPLVMFVWFAVDKLQRAGDDRTDAPAKRLSPGSAYRKGISSSRRTVPSA